MKNSEPHNPPRTTLLILAILLAAAALVPAWTVQASVPQTGSQAPYAASTPVVIYGDRLDSTWQDWSWNANRNFSSTTFIQSGSASLKVTITQAWGALYLHRATSLKTAGYTHLEFYVNGGTSGTQRLMLVANGKTAYHPQFSAPLNKWAKISLALTSLGSPASLSDLYFQDAAGKAQPAFYLDSIRLVDNSTTGPTATAVPTQAATSTSAASQPTATRTAAPTNPAATNTAAPTNPAATNTAVPTKPAATATALPTATKLPAPTQTPGTGSYFSLLPPGSVLPSDSQCAAAIKHKAENKRMNVTYNATAGNQHLASDFFGSAEDPRANTVIAARVDGNFTGTTDEILQWAACKWGFDEDMVRAQAAIESWWRQNAMGDWGSTAANCAPGHGLGADGQAGQCPESWGILQNRYPYEQSSWPGIQNSTAFNADTAYAEMRSCYEGYEWWLNNVDRGSQYGAGDAWGCVGRWFAGRWHTSDADGYISRVKDYLNQRIWETSGFQEP
jgi:hypothetical protein